MMDYQFQKIKIEFRGKHFYTSVKSLSLEYSRLKLKQNVFIQNKGRNPIKR